MISNISHSVPMSLSQARVSISQTTSPATSQVVADSTSQGAAQSGAANDVQMIGADNSLATAVDHLNANIQSLNRNLVFSLDKDSGNVVVKVVDSRTQEIIRQIPNEDVLALARHIKQVESEHHPILMQVKA